jgi:23S rRNA (pseudouridine1915-N3)-methyltransferase
MTLRLTVVAVGRLKAGPERALYDRYAERVAAAGRSVGVSLALREIADGRSSIAAERMAEEGQAILAALPADSLLVALDAGGTNLTSEAFAGRLAAWRDAATGNVALAIGGAEGLARPVLERAAVKIAFGAMTWPHQLVRLMLAEQIYRAVTILAGHPYHRG